MQDLIDLAITKGARLIASISGGKDGQVMAEVLRKNRYDIDHFVHADLGRIEWHESMGQCIKMSENFNRKLVVVKRTDKRDLVDHWQARLEKLKGTGKPFWSSKPQRYCTSDLKRQPIEKHFTATGYDFIISCEGIRAEESDDRALKQPLSIRWKKSSTYYRGMSVDQAIRSFVPGKKLVLDYYPIFNMTIGEVWATYGMDHDQLMEARRIYKAIGKVVTWWPFHHAYVYGNDRVSCVFCIMGSMNDLRIGAAHRPELLKTLIDMEDAGGATFKNKFSLKQLL